MTYILIGYRPHISPAAASNISAVLGHQYSSQLIGVAVRYLPDFAIFQTDDGRYFETIRQCLVEITEPKEITSHKAPYYCPTGKEITGFIKEATVVNNDLYMIPLDMEVIP